MVVIDCNAAINMAMHTPEGDGLAALLLEGERCIAPSLFVAETASAVSGYVRAKRLSQEDAVVLGDTCMALVDQLVDDALLWREAVAESAALGHSSYDMFYLVLARRNAATLLTLDKRLQRACAQAHVSCIGTDDSF